MKIGFDLISDLNLSPGENFDWENKATSLYCIVAGNVSSDIKTIRQTLSHISKFYQGVFYIPGALEFSDKHGVQNRLNELKTVCSRGRNVVLLHNHVVIIDGIAIVGVNGWAIEYNDFTLIDKIVTEVNRNEDLSYLSNSIERLQLHVDVKKIIIVSSSIPKADLYYGEIPENYNEIIPLAQSLALDKERKITHWVFGTQHKLVDVSIDNINYLNNCYLKDTPYWPKRFEA